MKTTKYFEDFLLYFEKAKLLEEGKGPVNDPLMDTIPIYDCVHRRNAGFSNVLEDLMRRGVMKWQGKKLVDYPFPLVLTIFLVHRVTGSGASFEFDHGYRNSRIFDMVEEDPQDWMNFLIESQHPIFTSIGNQIPPFPKPNKEYAKGSHRYFGEYLPKLVIDFCQYLDLMGQIDIREGVDFCLDWHVKHGLKRFVFVLTAFVMDVAEYFPEKVDPESHVYLGKNAVETIDLIFVDPITKRNEDKAMNFLLDATDRVNVPYDMEDVICDYIRYVENYIPRKGYEEHRATLLNDSLIKDHKKGRQLDPILGEIVNYGS